MDDLKGTIVLVESLDLQERDQEVLVSLKLGLETQVPGLDDDDRGAMSRTQEQRAGMNQMM